MLDAAPRQLGDVDHAINAADVYECAVRSQGLHGTGVLVANFDLAPNLLSSSATLFLLYRTDGTNHALALTVDLGDAETCSLTYQLAQRLALRDTGLRSRDEYADAKCVSNNAALVLFVNLALDDGLIFLCVLDGLPALHLVYALLGQYNGALCVVYANNNSFDVVAYVDALLSVEGRIVGQLMGRDVSSVLYAQIYVNFVRGDLQNSTGYLISCI